LVTRRHQRIGLNWSEDHLPLPFAEGRNELAQLEELFSYFLEREIPGKTVIPGRKNLQYARGG
jgi:hypothetical protein